MKLFRRLVVGVVVAVMALAALLAGSVVVDRALSGGRLAAVTNTVIPGGAVPEIRAYVARPSSPGPHPAVIMIHEFWGLNADIRDKADLLAEEGYVVVAPDMFRGATTSWIPSAIYQVVSTPPEQITADVDEVYRWLAAQPEVRADRIGILGFCFGGRTSLQYSHRGAVWPGDG
jgi:carboxymethylenebutenolidase